jgi:hypothetical protein
MEATVTWVTILGFAALLQQASAEGEHSKGPNLVFLEDVQLRFMMTMEENLGFLDQPKN